MLLLLLASHAEAQFTPTYVFSPGDPILASEVNANFSLLADALNRKGGTITGNIAVNADITIDGVDIDDFLKTTGHIRATTSGTAALPSFAPSGDTGTGIWFPALGELAISLSGTERFRLTSSGMTVFGTQILDSSGKVPGFTSTYFASLDGSAITNIPEANIIDGSILARVAANETITGGWSFTSTPTGLAVTQTWNNAGTVFTGLAGDITATAYAAGSKVVDLKVGGVSVWSISPTGTTTTTTFQMTTGATNGYVLTSDASGNASWQALPGGTTGVPSGMVAMFETSCPSGWTMRSGAGQTYENKFIRGGATYSAVGGGSDTHTHSVDPPSTATTSAGAHTHTVDVGSTSTSTDGSHTHSVSGTTDSGGSHSHSFTTGGPSATSTAASGVDVGVATSAHTHSGNTDSQGSHSHTFSATSSADGSHSHTSDPAAVTSSSAGDHTHSIDVGAFSSASASNVPAYVQVVFCKKD